MPITRPAAPILLASAEINDEYGVDLTVSAGGMCTVRRLTAAEAYALADELREAAIKAGEYAAAEATA